MSESTELIGIVCETGFPRMKCVCVCKEKKRNMNGKEKNRL